MKTKIYFNKKVLVGIITLSTIFVFQFYTVVETALAVTDNVVVTLTVDSGITISDGAAVTMAPNLSVTANSSIGTSTWTVITNDTDGYKLDVTSFTAPAMKHSDTVQSIADYTEAVAGTPDLWSVPSGSKEFGFSAFGTDTNTTTWGSGANCGSAGTPTGTLKYAGAATNNDSIATRATVTPTAGITTTICFAAEQDTVFAASGTYTATIIGTATVL